MCNYGYMYMLPMSMSHLGGYRESSHGMGQKSFYNLVPL